MEFIDVHAISKAKIRKGDTVMVIAGRERGKTGKVLGLVGELGKVTVEKLNVIKGIRSQVRRIDRAAF